MYIDGGGAPPADRPALIQLILGLFTSAQILHWPLKHDVQVCRYRRNSDSEVLCLVWIGSLLQMYI